MPAPNPGDDDVTLVVGGRRLTGCTRFELRAPVEGMPRSFNFTVTERFTAPAQIVADPPAAVLLYLGRDLALTSRLDRYMPSYDMHQHNVQIVGRGLCAILVDCPVDVFATGWAIAAKTIRQAITAICTPFFLKVRQLPDTDIELPPEMQIIAVPPGYIAYGLAEEFTRSVGVLMYEDERGAVVLSSGGAAGRAGSAIVEGINAERVEGMLSTDHRFARYYVLSQNRLLLDVFDNVVAQAKDPQAALLDPRLRIIPQEFPDVSLQYSVRRAQWEANRRWGRAQIVRVTVTGWRDGQGKLWAPNTMVNVQLPTAKVIKADRVITEVVYQRDEAGTRSILTLMPQKALEVQPFTVPIPV
jgi:prophage tail gpP-like protein